MIDTINLTGLIGKIQTPKKGTADTLIYQHYQNVP